MEKTLLDEFRKYEEIKNIAEICNYKELSPTATLPLICSQILDNAIIDTRRVIYPEEKYFVIDNEIITRLYIPKYNFNTIKFISHELSSNIYDHSKFNIGYLMGKSYPNFTEISFIDNGISIPNSLKNRNYYFENDCVANIKAINGLSTKNELGYIERGTGLNNTINIVANGFNGSVLIASGSGLVHITQKNLEVQTINEQFKGTLVSLRINFEKKVDIYNYLNQITYKY